MCGFDDLIGDVMESGEIFELGAHFKNLPDSEASIDCGGCYRQRSSKFVGGIKLITQLTVG